MDIQLQLLTSLNRRASLLSNEVGYWQQLANANAEGMGIHQTQVKAIKFLFEEQEVKQEAAKNALETATLLDFASKRMVLEYEMLANHGIMAIFRNIFAQREDETYYRRVLDFSDLVAADCYKLCTRLTIDWEAITQNELRVPPLTYLNTMYSPAAFTRRHTFSAFKMPLDSNRELMLPISIISLPYHHTQTVWTFCSIYHEVGHLLDQDLKLTTEVSTYLLEGLSASERVSIWRTWCRELIADAFGILLGGMAFAQIMMKLLFLPKDEVIVSPSEAEDRIHPTPYVRVFILGALLRGLQRPELSTTAINIEQQCREIYGDQPTLKPFLDECALVVNILLSKPLIALKNHKLSDFASNERLGKDQELISKLGRFLCKGILRPQPEGFPMRLIPVAAQLSLSAVTDDHATAYQNIQQRALEFAAAIRATLPMFLGPEDEISDERETFLRNLVRNLNFTTLGENFF